jgi:hypothetical protein
VPSRLGGGPRPLTPAHDQPLGLLDHPEQVFDRHVLDKAGVSPVEEDARAHAIVVADYDPGGDTNLPHLRSVVAAHDQMGTKRSRLPVEGIGVGEVHVVVGALSSDGVRERLAVHGGRYGDQYAHDDLCGLSPPERIPVRGEWPEMVAFLGYIPILDANQAMRRRSGRKCIE